MKNEKLLEIWVRDDAPDFKLLKIYPILRTSGTSGPKLEDGDMQVPEGLYKIESLNPNSLYHLALRINYPNSFDRAKAESDNRKNLGSDIMIHGKNCSIGCLAMGDEAVEDIFILAAETGINNIAVILSPVDFRTREFPATRPNTPGWVPELYSEIKKELKKLPRTKSF